MRFQKGNKYGKGRPRVPEIEELRKALEKAKKQTSISFLDHCITKAYDDTQMAIAILKKLLPDKIHEQINLEQINSEIDQIIKIVLRYCPIDARKKIIKELQK